MVFVCVCLYDSYQVSTFMYITYRWKVLVNLENHVLWTFGSRSSRTQDTVIYIFIFILQLLGKRDIIHHSGPC